MKLKNECAYDATGNIVLASEAVKGQDYFCPSCREKFVFKNSGKTGRGSKCAHFSHTSESNCNESALHAIFKQKAVRILREYIARNEPFGVAWICQRCRNVCRFNMLGTVARGEEEFSLGVGCPRPDIVLFDVHNKPVMVIEIVVNHEPEDSTAQYYKNNEIFMFKYYPQLQDLHKVEECLRYPKVDCRCPKCPPDIVLQARQKVVPSKYVMERGKWKRKPRF